MLRYVIDPSTVGVTQGDKGGPLGPTCGGFYKVVEWVTFRMSESSL